MQSTDCFELGFILRPHGLKGDVLVVIDADEPDFYSNLKLLYLEAKSGLVPYVVTQWKLRGSQAYVHLQGVEHVDDAALLKGRKVFLPATELPTLEDDQFYFHDLAGYLVLNADGTQEIGTVKEVLEMPQQDMLVLDVQGHEALVPLVDDFLVKIDKGAKTLYMRLPEGLVEIYTESGKE